MPSRLDAADLRHLFRATVFGVLVGFAIALLALVSPDRMFVGSTWAPDGVRLFHDSYEISIFRLRSQWVADRAIPYDAAHWQEYPPLGALFIALPRLYSEDVATFEAASLVRSAFTFGILFGLTSLLLRRFGLPRRRLALLFMPAFLYFSFWRYDALPAIFTSLAVLAVATGRFGGALWSLWAGALAKIYPAFFLLPFVMRLGNERGDGVRRAMLRAVIGVAAVTAALLALAHFSGINPVKMMFGVHTRRDVEIGSIRELVLRAAEITPRDPARKLADVAFILLQFGAFIPLLIRGRVRDARAFVRASVYVLIPFMTFGWFFSQQWIVWLLPLLMLVAAPVELALLAVLDVVLFLQFPVAYDANRHGAAFDALTAVRTAVLLALWTLNARAMTSIKRRPPPAARTGSGA